MFDPVILHSLMVTIEIVLVIGCVLGGIALVSYLRMRRRGIRQGA